MSKLYDITLSMKDTQTGYVQLVDLRLRRPLQPGQAKLNFESQQPDGAVKVEYRGEVVECKEVQ